MKQLNTQIKYKLLNLDHNPWKMSFSIWVAHLLLQGEASQEAVNFELFVYVV